MFEAIFYFTAESPGSKGHLQIRQATPPVKLQNRRLRSSFKWIDQHIATGSSRVLNWGCPPTNTYILKTSGKFKQPFMPFEYIALVPPLFLKTFRKQWILIQGRYTFIRIAPWTLVSTPNSLRSYWWKHYNASFSRKKKHAYSPRLYTTGDGHNPVNLLIERVYAPSWTGSTEFVLQTFSEQPWNCLWCHSCTGCRRRQRQFSRGTTSHTWAAWQRCGIWIPIVTYHFLAAS